MSKYRRRLMMNNADKILPDYLCFTALESGTFTLTIGANVPSANYQYVEYSVDGGENWVKTVNADSTLVVVTTPSIDNGGTVLWRGIGTSMSVNTGNFAADGSCVFSSSGEFDVSGHICSLLYGSSSSSYNELPSGQSTFFGLFNNAKKLINAKDLKLPNNTRYYAYKRFMSGCSGLLTAPVFPADNAVEQSYNSTFYNCTSLTESPYLRATGGSGIYICQQMFYGCRNMNYIKVMFKTRPTSTAFANWTTNVASAGIFVKHIEATWTYTGVSGVPSEWTVIYYNPDTDKYYLSDRATECDDHGNPILGGG